MSAVALPTSDVVQDSYHPLYFLAALGAGGMAVTFFMYPMFMVEHRGTPLVTFDHLAPLLMGEAPWWTRIALVAVLLGIGYFALLHYRLLLWNWRAFAQFKRRQEYGAFVQSPRVVTLMAIPLTLAMTVNVSFIVGAIFVPGLWSVVEYLFLPAIVAFLAVGIYGLRLFFCYMVPRMAEGGGDFLQDNGLSPLLAIFAFAMVAVGLAAPGAMSQQLAINALGLTLSAFFLSGALLLGVAKLIIGFNALLTKGVTATASPSLWMLIPIFTLIGITAVRFSFGLHHGFNAPISPPGLLVLLAMLLSLQLWFGLLGYGVMRRLNYFRDYLYGDQRDVGSYALICPGVALFVLAMFFLHIGLVHNGVITLFSPLYWLLLLPLLLLQLKTLAVAVHLNRRLLASGHALGRLQTP